MTALTHDDLEKLADELVDWFCRPGSIWLRDFATAKGTYWQVVLELADRCDKLALAIKICHDMQVSKLVKLGLSKEVNAAVPIFALKNVAGWRDKFEINHEGGIEIKTDGDPYKALADRLAELGLAFTALADAQTSSLGAHPGDEGGVPKIPAHVGG